ncbi:MAG: 50S ribosomal protein L19 [Chloroflexota bacterium]
MKIESVVNIKANPKIPALSPGDTVKVSVRVVEGDKSRLQPFQGVVIRVHHHDSGGSFTVRRVTYNVGVERTFLLNSPLLEKVDVLRHGKVRRANLYYLRGISTKASRLKENRRREIAPELIATPEPEPEVVPESKPQAEEKPQAEQKPQSA